MDPSAVPDVRVKEVWSPTEPSPLNKSSECEAFAFKGVISDLVVLPLPAVARIAASLAKAKKPLIVTSYAGRNPEAVEQLTKLVDLVAVPVFSSCISNVNIAFNHPSHAGVSFGQPNELVEEADFILILDSDVPWFVDQIRTFAARQA